MSIKEWPEDERPREKLLRRGAGVLSDAELLAIFLRTGVSGLSAVDLSRQLLQQFGRHRAQRDGGQEVGGQGGVHAWLQKANTRCGGARAGWG